MPQALVCSSIYYPLTCRSRETAGGKSRYCEGNRKSGTLENPTFSYRASWSGFSISPTPHKRLNLRFLSLKIA